MQRTKEIFMEVKKSLVGASSLGSKDKLSEEIDPSMLTTFLETCMKLVRHSKAVKGLK